MIADDMTWKEVKRKVGEMANMENDLRQAQASRDYWKAKCEGLERGLCERYVKLPVDADGETIHLRAVVAYDGRAWRVRTLMLAEDGWLLDGVRSDGSMERTIRPEDCAVMEQRTVEDVLREFAEKMNENMGMYTGGVIDADEWRIADSATISEYADEIRQMLDD